MGDVATSQLATLLLPGNSNAILRPAMTTPLLIAIDIAGSQAALAQQIEAAPQFVSHWVTGRRPIPARYALAIERFTEGKVTAHQLLPGVFPPDQQAANADSEPDPDAGRVVPVEEA